MKYIKDKKFLILLIFLIICLIGGVIYFTINEDNENEIVLNEMTSKKESTTNVIKFYVDIKGNVNKPGVYEFKENDRVIDAINKAGGLTKNANTNNINLSKKLSSEMVIYVYSNKEIKSNDNLTCNNICDIEVIEVNNCIENNLSNNEKLVNINNASLEELLTIIGIGESKAKSIIEYRESNGKFENIEDIKNVSGIGDALYEKIKDKITL